MVYTYRHRVVALTTASPFIFSGVAAPATSPFDGVAGTFVWLFGGVCISTSSFVGASTSVSSIAGNTTINPPEGLMVPQTPALLLIGRSSIEASVERLSQAMDVDIDVGSHIHVEYYKGLLYPAAICKFQDKSSKPGVLYHYDDSKAKLVYWLAMEDIYIF